MFRCPPGATPGYGGRASGVRDEGGDGTRGGGSLWYDGPVVVCAVEPYVRCACGGIRSLEGQCPVCGEDPPSPDWVVVRDADGTELRVPPTFMGADGGFEDWVFLRMLEREWLRPVEPDLYASIPEEHDLVERDLLVEAIVELGGAGGLVPRDPGRDLEVAAVSEVLRDPRTAEAVREVPKSVGSSGDGKLGPGPDSQAP